ncbi:hypothetical protein SAMN05720766_10897 [Fibrobacter sp. UWH9]|nr:hypothetical protein SAMN05720766_10897 [Fibrobacter sp. UWH9]
MSPRQLLVTLIWKTCTCLQVVRMTRQRTHWQFSWASMNILREFSALGSAELCEPTLEGWGSGFQRINTMCQEYGVALPEFTEIGDMFRVNFYRRQNSEIGDKIENRR